MDRRPTQYLPCSDTMCLALTQGTSAGLRGRSGRGGDHRLRLRVGPPHHERARRHHGGPPRPQTPAGVGTCHHRHRSLPIVLPPSSLLPLLLLPSVSLGVGRTWLLGLESLDAKSSHLKYTLNSLATAGTRPCYCASKRPAALGTCHHRHRSLPVPLTPTRSTQSEAATLRSSLHASDFKDSKFHFLPPMQTTTATKASRMSMACH